MPEAVLGSDVSQHAVTVVFLMSMTMVILAVINSVLSSAASALTIVLLCIVTRYHLRRIVHGESRTDTVGMDLRRCYPTFPPESSG